MKYKTLINTSLLSIITSLCVQADNTKLAPNDENVAEKNKKPPVTKELSERAKQLNTRFSNLPLEKRSEYIKLRSDAHRFFSKKRTFETLLNLHKMKAIFDEDPLAYNLFGAVYVEFRDFRNARAIFKKALIATENDPKVLFNLAELEFCDNKWKSAISHFKALLKRVPSDMSNDFTKIIEFKVMLCKLALSKSEDSSISESQKKKYLAEAKQLTTKYSYMIDSPFYYYANAAIAFYNEDKTTASTLVLKAKKVYSSSPQLLSSWDDTLVEFGYIQSHYGKNHKEAPTTEITP